MRRFDELSKEPLNHTPVPDHDFEIVSTTELHDSRAKTAAVIQTYTEAKKAVDEGAKQVTIPAGASLSGAIDLDVGQREDLRLLYELPACIDFYHNLKELDEQDSELKCVSTSKGASWDCSKVMLHLIYPMQLV